MDGWAVCELMDEWARWGAWVNGLMGCGDVLVDERMDVYIDVFVHTSRILQLYYF